MWMTRSYSYHIIDSLIPPTLEEDNNLKNSLSRLESICACAIVRDTTNNCKWFSEIPRRLHIVLWKAYLRDEYYKHRNSSTSFDHYKIELSGFEIYQLLYHWPNEEFTLREVMPSFPAKLSWFSLLWHEYDDVDNPMMRNITYLETFYRKTIEIVFENFTKSKSRYFNNTHKHECKIIKLDISGLDPPAKGLFNINQVSKLSGDIVLKLGRSMRDSMTVTIQGRYCQEKTEDVRRLHFVPNDCKSSSCTHYYYNKVTLSETEINRNPFVKAGDQLEVNLDAHVVDKNRNEKKSIERAIKIFNSSSNTIYRCGHLRQLQLVEIEKNSKIGSLELISVYETTTDQINILSFELCGRSYSLISNQLLPLNVLSQLRNLEHLSVGNIDLHGKLEPLLHMEKGLHSLFLHYCKLNNSDLDVLLRSCHKSTLLELSLFCNRFHEGDIKNLIKLCQELPKLITLNFHKCMLEELHENDLYRLFVSISSLPNLAHLDLGRNYFSMDIITSHLGLLRNSPSLRILILTRPAKVTQSKYLRGSFEERYAAIKKFSAILHTTMNKGRSQLLYVEFGEELKHKDFQRKNNL